MKINNLLERKLENLSLDINNKNNALTRDVDDSRENERQMFMSRQNELQSENLLLKQENEALNERITNISYTRSDLNTKVKNCENKKFSLVAAVIQADNQNAMNSERVWQTQKTIEGKLNKQRVISIQTDE